MKPLYFKYQLFVLISLIFFSACGVLKHAERPLLTKNKVVIHGEKYELKKDELESLITQKPNKSFLGLWRFKLYSYQLPDRGEPTKFRYKMREKFGEAPVYYEPRTTATTIRQMQNYLHKTGYFNSKVWEEQKKKKYTTRLFYNIELSKPYRIRNIDFNILDTAIAKQVEGINEESLIHKNNIYNAFTLDDERDRITDHLKNNGYFNFNPEYIYYAVDSSLKSNQLDITMHIKNVESIDIENPNFRIKEDHKQYYINKVFVNPEFELLTDQKIKYDTVSVQTHRDTVRRKVQTYHFLLDGKPRIRPRAITNSILIRPNELFSIKNVKNTYRRLGELRNFRYSNIHFEEVKDSTNGINRNLLNCFIHLSRSPTHSYTIEAEGTNSGGDMGIGANLIYTNRNIFRGAELLEVRLSTAMEAQQSGEGVTSLSGRSFLFFNTIEAGIDVSLTFPKFLIPINPETFPQNFKPKTRLNTGFNYQQRPNYRRYITNISFGYDWSESIKTRHILNPIEISSIKVFPTDEFAEVLAKETNERIKNQYTDHLIMGLKYSFIYNSQDINKNKNFVFIRANFESAGFLMKGIHTLLKTGLTGKYNTLFNIRYAQYVRADVDFRYYKIFTPDSRLVYRALIGIGFPYGNSDLLPFEKGFFAGGANGMRGWGIRSLGPGTYKTSSEEENAFERVGDVRLELNMEYRFPLYRRLKGAIFIDAGNIWQLKDNEVFTGGKFEFNKFYKQIAMDAGLGFRLDFQFFVFRIDAAMRLRDPGLPEGEKLSRALYWNFGIGYPF